MDMKAISYLVALGSAAAFSGVFLMSSILIKFVALKKPPKERAMWTIGVSFTTYMVLLLTISPSEYVFPAIALSILPTLLIYIYFKRELIKLWYDDPSLIPDGVKIANDDWRVGLYLLVSAVIAALIKSAHVVLAVN